MESIRPTALGALAILFGLGSGSCAKDAPIRKEREPAENLRKADALSTSETRPSASDPSRYLDDEGWLREPVTLSRENCGVVGCSGWQWTFGTRGRLSVAPVDFNGDLGEEHGDGSLTKSQVAALGEALARSGFSELRGDLGGGVYDRHTIKSGEHWTRFFYPWSSQLPDPVPTESQGRLMRSWVLAAAIHRLIQEVEPGAVFRFTDTEGEERFHVKLIRPGDVAHARRILRGDETLRIHIAGTIVKEPASYNPQWSFHLEPSSIHFFEAKIEFCDSSIVNLAEHIGEAGGAFLPNLQWCPWTSRLVDEVD